MSKDVKALLAAVAMGMILTSLAWAGSIKTWSSGETLRSSDLNTTFTHVHDQAEALITNSKVHSNAAIAHSKLATPALIPKIIGYVSCVPSTCTVQAQSSGISSVTYSGAGDYVVNFTARTNAAYIPMVSGIDSTQLVNCRARALATGSVGVVCNEAAVAVDTAFAIVIFDDNNT